MKRSQFVLFSFVFLIGGLAVNGQEPSKRAKIERLVDVMKSDAIQTQMMDQVKSMLMSQMPPGTNPEQSAQQQEFFGKIMDLMKSKISAAGIHTQYVRLYDETYSEEEISGMLAFYESPTGRAVLEKMPLLIAKSMELMKAQMAGIMPEIQRIAQETLKPGSAPKTP